MKIIARASVDGAGQQDGKRSMAFHSLQRPAAVVGDGGAPDSAGPATSARNCIKIAKRKGMVLLLLASTSLPLSAGLGSSSRHTSSPLTVDVATASSEYGGYPAEKLIDGDMNSLAHTSDALPAANEENGVGQLCPWWQLDLGATKTVDKVKLTAQKVVNRMRRLLYVVPMNNNYVTYSGGDMTEPDEERSGGGVRVLVGNSARNRADTSELLDDGRWSGNAVGSICPEPATAEVCETIQCDDPATCLDRFAEEPTATGIGTTAVDCNGKQGRYVTIELPGITADDTGLIRTAGFTEVRVEGTSPPLTVDVATASSEYGGYPAEKLIDGDMNSLAHTSDALPAANEENGVGQLCPWWQLDLGATKTVDKVKLTAQKVVNRMRRLLYVVPMNNNYVTYSGGDMTEPDEERSGGGVRVLVGNSARNRADTSELLDDGRWSGNAVGSICPEPATAEVCETIQCDDPATCLDRFAEEPNASGIGTTAVDCNGKQGRYVTIELPGITADDTGLIRTAGFTEVRVEGTSPSETDGGVAEQQKKVQKLAEFVADAVAYMVDNAVGGSAKIADADHLENAVANTTAAAIEAIYTSL